MLLKSNIKLLLFDIEGTTTSISFVKDTLFPYVRENLNSYLRSRWTEQAVQADIERIRKLTEEQLTLGDPGLRPIPLTLSQSLHENEHVLECVEKNILHWMDGDKKLGPLKTLQGHIWRHAYENRLIKGHLYADTKPAFEKAREKNLRLCIYSSGSVEAQKLLFKYSIDGDITPLLSDYFDTGIGLKNEAQSYLKIAEKLLEQPENILFLTDVEAEGRAAREARMEVVLLVRPGNGELSVSATMEFRTLTSILELFGN